MKLDNVYVATILVVTSHDMFNIVEKRALVEKYKLKAIKYALIYSKHEYSETNYYDLQTDEKYHTLKNYPEIGDLVVDVKNMMPYREFLYMEQEINHNLKVKDNMFKKKMLTLFNDARKRTFGGNV